MTWKSKMCLFVCIIMTFICVTPAVASDLTRVTVIVEIEKPDYFWQYPFLGKHLDQINISSFGKTFSIPALSDTDKFEIDVPTDYFLRMNIQLQHDGTTLQSISYVSKNRVTPSRTTFTIKLKAPEPQSITISSGDFERSRP